MIGFTWEEIERELLDIKHRKPASVDSYTSWLAFIESWRKMADNPMPSFERIPTVKEVLNRLNNKPWVAIGKHGHRLGI